jgi:hypothetical protein
MSGVIHRSALAVALVAALFPGVASASSCADTHLVPTRSNSERIEAATLCLVNVQRARHRANILNTDFRDTGLGVVARAPRRYGHGQRGATYTQQFGAVTRH